MIKNIRKILSILLVAVIIVTTANIELRADDKGITELFYGSGAIRSMTKINDGSIIGGRSSGHEIEVWKSNNNGSSWSKIGTVAQNASINYGDVMFLAVPNTNTVYCAFREYNSSSQYAVVVCKSDDGGVNWSYDSTVISGCTEFVGAPWLFIAENGDMQCYYDSEPLATENGVRGSQWIAMQGRDGLTGDWTKYGVVAASRDQNASKFIRDGMASVVDLGNNRIMVVTEGIEDSQSGGSYANVVRAIESYDGGLTWDYAGRHIVYQSAIDSNSGRRYNAYCPMAIRVGNGPVGVIFCTDEDFGGTPDASNENVTERRTHIKYIRTLDSFERWGGLTPIWTDGSQAYAPGMVETASNEILISIDHFSGKQRFYYMDALRNVIDTTTEPATTEPVTTEPQTTQSINIIKTNVANERGNYTFMTSNANNGTEGFCYVGNGFSAINASNENLTNGNNMLGATATTDEVAIYIDLGASYDINSALIYQGSTNANYFDSYCTNYSIYYSTEQVNTTNKGDITWQLAGTCTNGTIYSGSKVKNAANVSSTGDAIDFDDIYTARSVKVVFDKESCMGTGVNGDGTGTTGTVSLLSVRIYAVSEEKETTTSSPSDGDSENGTVTPPATGEATDILFIGNSMTYYNELQDIFESFANFMGKNVNTKAATNGGQNLIYQSTANNVLSAIDDGGYEVVIIQDIVSSFNANNLMTGAKAIINIIKQYNPNAKILFYEPWPRETSLIGASSRLDEFTQGYINAARETGGVLAPAGEAFYDGYVSYGYNYYADGLHPIPMGSYTSAVTIYYALYADEALRTFTEADLAGLNAAVNVAQSNKVNYALEDFNNITANGYKYARAVAPAVEDKTGNTKYTSALYTIEDPAKKVQADLSVYSEIDLSNSSVIDVSSSVNNTNTGDKIIDKNYGSRWESEYSDPQYFTIALDKTYTLNGIKLYWETAASKNYVIQTSTDNTNWTTVFEQKVGNAGSGYGDDKKANGLESIKFDTVTDANYIRLYSTARTTGYGVSLFEARLFGSVAGEQISPDVPDEPGIVISDDVKVEGYQISDVSQGSRVIGSVEPTINGLDVQKWGFVYAIEEVGTSSFSVPNEEMVVGSDNVYIEAIESTPIGTSDAIFGNSTTATYFVRTMLFAQGNATELNAKYKVRAYALLSDGSYVYSDVKSYRVVNIAKYLYENKKMSNYSGHSYLYNNIITVVDPTYAEVDYAWGNVIAKPEEVDE